MTERRPRALRRYQLKTPLQLEEIAARTGAPIEIADGFLTVETDSGKYVAEDYTDALGEIPC